VQIKQEGLGVQVLKAKGGVGGVWGGTNLDLTNVDEVCTGVSG
jgi:hypothetical protein